MTCLSINSFKPLSLSLSVYQKMTQLEEELDQKNSEIEHLKKQLDTLTAPQGDEDAQAWMNDPKLLQRQLMKMQQSMRVGMQSICFCNYLERKINNAEIVREKGTYLEKRNPELKGEMDLVLRNAGT